MLLRYNFLRPVRSHQNVRQNDGKVISSIQMRQPYSEVLYFGTRASIPNLIVGRQQLWWWWEGRCFSDGIWVGMLLMVVALDVCKMADIRAPAPSGVVVTLLCITKVHGPVVCVDLWWEPYGHVPHPPHYR
jgi:hypothetical protein